MLAARDFWSEGCHSNPPTWYVMTLAGELFGERTRVGVEIGGCYVHRGDDHPCMLWAGSWAG